MNYYFNFLLLVFSPSLYNFLGPETDRENALYRAENALSLSLINTGIELLLLALESIFVVFGSSTALLSLKSKRSTFGGKMLPRSSPENQKIMNAVPFPSFFQQIIRFFYLQSLDHLIILDHIFILIISLILDHNLINTGSSVIMKKNKDFYYFDKI